METSIEKRNQMIWYDHMIQMKGEAVINNYMAEMWAMKVMLINEKKIWWKFKSGLAAPPC